MKRSILRFLADERGAAAVEYGLICALIFLVVVTAVTAFSEAATAVFNRASAALVEAMARG